MTRSTDIKQLIDEAFEEIVAGDIARARRQLMRARNVAKADQDWGQIEAGEIGCAAAETLEQAQEKLDLVSPETLASPEFTNGLGCGLSEIGYEQHHFGIMELAAQAFERSPCTHTSALVALNHGVVLTRLERDDEAVEAFARALELDPEAPDIHLRLAECHETLGELDAAADAYRKHLEHNPNDVDEWISLAIVECDAGRHALALQAYWRAAGLAPNNVSLHFNWLITAKRIRNFEQARDAAGRLHAVAPDDWRARSANAVLKEMEDDTAGAFELVSTLLTELLNEADADEDEVDTAIDRGALTYVAGWALGLASRGNIAGERVDGLIDQIFAAWIFDDEILHLLREREQPEPCSVHDYYVRVDALASEVAYFQGCRLYAGSEDQARTMAIEFERRCGASEVLIDTVTDHGEVDEPQYPGVHWRDEVVHSYDAADFGKQD